MEFSLVNLLAPPEGSANDNLINKTKLLSVMDVIEYLKSKNFQIDIFNNNKEKIFYELVEESKKSNIEFCDNWPYIIQACRNFNGVIKNKNGTVYLTRRWKKSSKYLVIVNYFGKGAIKMIKELLDMIKETPYKLVVKNVNSEKEKELKDIGFREYNSKESWINFESSDFWKNHPSLVSAFTENDFTNSEFRYDDNTFPEMIYDIKTLLNMNGMEFEWLRKSINRFNRRYGDITYLSKYNQSEHEIKAKQLLSNWAEYMESKLNETKEEATRAHNFCFDEEIKNKIRFVLIKKETNEIIAVSYLTPVKDKLYVNAIFQDENYDNLKKWFLIKSVEKVKNEGYRILNLQGSETNNLNDFKRKFRPSREIKMKHLVFP